jgi:hypothetical protein
MAAILDLPERFVTKVLAFFLSAKDVTGLHSAALFRHWQFHFCLRQV